MTGRTYSFIVGGAKIKPAYTGNAQRKSKVGQDAQILDESLENFKKPNSDLDVSQKIAKTAETVPIVFGKRANNIGGVWMQPSLIKAGTDKYYELLQQARQDGTCPSLDNLMNQMDGNTPYCHAGWDDFDDLPKLDDDLTASLNGR